MTGTATSHERGEQGCAVVADATRVEERKPGPPAGAGDVPASLRHVACVAHRSAGAEPHSRSVPEETPVAFTYNGTSYAVMMATPSDLPDFAVGFSLTEGVIGSPADIASLDIVSHEAGIELRMWLASARASALSERRHRLRAVRGRKSRDRGAADPAGSRWDHACAGTDYRRFAFAGVRAGTQWRDASHACSRIFRARSRPGIGARGCRAA
jgi:hypothetical protein